MPDKRSRQYPIFKRQLIRVAKGMVTRYVSVPWISNEGKSKGLMPEIHRDTLAKYCGQLFYSAQSRLMTTPQMKVLVLLFSQPQR